jgi:hypothetical protein
MRDRVTVADPRILIGGGGGATDDSSLAANAHLLYNETMSFMFTKFSFGGGGGGGMDLPWIRHCRVSV